MFRPLHYATDNGSVKMVKALIRARADVWAETVMNNTALHMAVRNGNLDIAKELIQALAKGEERQQVDL